MGLRRYSVLKCRPSALELDDDESPHIEIRGEAASVSYRIAVNVRSQLFPNDLLFRQVRDFQHPMLASLKRLPEGITSLDGVSATLALDYVRGGFIDRQAMSVAPFQLTGPENDLRDYIEPLIREGIANGNMEIYAFGEPWGPEPGLPDKYFEFEPGNGIHDIHMNQGSRGRFASDNGVNQDGALIVRLQSDDRWIAFFLAFQSQDWNTDAQTGHPLSDQPVPDEPVTPLRPSVSIVCALVNPAGEESGRESVTLLNRSDVGVDLAQWALVDKQDRALAIAGHLDAGETRRVFLETGEGAMRLANKGGSILVRSPDGTIAHAVSYTKAQVALEDWTIVFG